MLTQPPLRAADYLAGCLLAALLFCIYNLNFRHGVSVDSISTTALPVSIIREGNLDLDEFRTLLTTNTRALDLSLNEFGGIQQQHGHLVTSYPLGSAILAVPFFWVADRMHYLREWHHYRVVGKIAASFMVALSAAFVFFALRLWLSANVSWLIAVFFGLGTSAWPVSSQELMQHGSGTLCLAISVYLLMRFCRAPAQRLALMAGLFLALAVTCRLLNIIPVIALAAFILLHHRRYAIAFFAPLLAGAIPLALYNVATYGHLSGGYDAIYQSHWHAWRGLNSGTAFTHPLLQGLYDVVVSPGRGLLVYSPFLIPAYVAAIYFVIRPPQPLLRYLALWVLLMTVALAKNTLWWGGSSFGPRYFSETCVALAIMTGALWPLLTRRKRYCAGFVACGLLSISISGIGAFFAPGGCADPTALDQHLEWLRSWRHPELVRCVRVVMAFGPQPPEMLRYKTGDTDF